MMTAIYCILGIKKAVNRILPINSMMLEKTGNIFCPIACSAFLVLFSTPRIKKQGATTRRYSVPFCKTTISSEPDMSRIIAGANIQSNIVMKIVITAQNSYAYFIAFRMRHGCFAPQF